MPATTQPKTLRLSSEADITQGTRVLVRVDANIPWQASDDALDAGGPRGRIAQTAKEVLALAKRGAVVAMVTHWGDPAGKTDATCSTRRLAPLFEKILKKKVTFIGACMGSEVSAAIAAAKPGEIFLLENIRFFRAEERDDGAFAKALAAPFSIFVNNAFGVAHRAHASVHAIALQLPAYAGELVAREVAALSQPVTHPFVVILGGAKLDTKVPLLERLGPRADKILVGGGVAIAIQIAHGDDVPGASGTYRRKDILAQARKVLHSHEMKLVFPVDVVASPKEEKVLDIGPKTIEQFIKALQNAKTVIWNGPLGIVEEAEGQTSTRTIATHLAKGKADVIVGGGDTVDFLERLGLAQKFTHVSTGGGAMLAYLSGERMPGLEPLWKVE